MTLHDYLSGPAVEDVRKLLADLPARQRSNGTWKPAGEAGLRVNGESSLLRLSKFTPWMRVSLATKRDDLMGFTIHGAAYYRETSPGSYIVSDCGETVSEVMRRTGKTWREALAFLHLIETGQELPEAPADICCEDVEDLAQAIVTVLTIAAQARAAIDNGVG